MWIANGPTGCERISSIYVYSPTYNGSFEFGWLIGWNNINDKTYGTPRLFWHSETAGTHSVQRGIWSLSNIPTPGQDDTFRVSDENANTYWGAYWQGNPLQPAGVNMDFSRGHSVVGMEHIIGTDSGWARWQNLDEYHDGNT
ncbi:MAG: hypothetical protein ACR2K3_02635 [Nocardioides sp.]